MKTGTYEWAHRTKGALSPWRKLGQALQVLSRQIRSKMLTHGPSPVNLADIALPDSAMARQAVNFCSEISSPQLLNHCLRTYVFGEIIARLEGLRPDAELFFLSAMLHDAGLSDKHFHKSPVFCCFAAEGAMIAEDHLRIWGYDERRTRMVAENICLHLNVSVSASDFGVEAYLLREASGLDIAGIGSQRINARNRIEVFRQYPRSKDLLTEVGKKLQQEATRFPKSRTAFLAGIGFTRMVEESGRLS